MKILIRRILVGIILLKTCFLSAQDRSIIFDRHIDWMILEYETAKKCNSWKIYDPRLFDASFLRIYNNSLLEHYFCQVVKLYKPEEDDWLLTTLKVGYLDKRMEFIVQKQVAQGYPIFVLMDNDYSLLADFYRQYPKSPFQFVTLDNYKKFDYTFDFEMTIKMNGGNRWEKLDLNTRHGCNIEALDIDDKKVLMKYNELTIKEVQKSFWKFFYTFY